MFHPARQISYHLSDGSVRRDGSGGACACARCSLFHAVFAAESCTPVEKPPPAPSRHGSCPEGSRPDRRTHRRLAEPDRERRSRIGEAFMEIEILADADAVAQRGAAIIAAEARTAAAARGRFVMAVSGGHTPWLMLRALAGEDVPWTRVHVVQVDERVAPAGHPDRNLTHLRESLLGHAPLVPEQIHAMPVESPDLETAAAQYAATLRQIAGSPPVLDLVHLGLGPDGHTAS